MPRGKWRSLLSDPPQLAGVYWVKDQQGGLRLVHINASGVMHTFVYDGSTLQVPIRNYKEWQLVIDPYGRVY